jgi:hypothetical protein
VRRRRRRKSVESSEIHGDERDFICSGEHHHDVVAAFCCCIIYAGQHVGGTPVPQGDWSKLKLKQASSKNKKKKKEAPTKDASKREGLHDCLEIWPVRKHAILNSNINILSRELQMEQKK